MTEIIVKTQEEIREVILDSLKEGTVISIVVAEERGDENDKQE